MEEIGIINLKKAHYDEEYTHKYIFGVKDKNDRVTAYIIDLTLDGFLLMFNESPTYAKRQTVVKFRSSRLKVEYLKKHAIQVIDLMNAEELKSKRRLIPKTDGSGFFLENCGDCFEWLMAEYLNGKQATKRNASFTESGDIIVNGIHYQCKYEKSGISVRL